MTDQRAFTLKSDKGKLNVLKTDCGVCVAHKPAKGVPHPKVENFIGLWDTGATGTVISSSVVQKLNLKPISKAKVYHADGDSIVNVYLINLFLPNKVAIPFVKVTEGKLNGTDLLIGMDVISLGDFSITNVSGNTTFSFRVPSSVEIDYVKEGNEVKKPTTSNKVGRNAPCPCGSGKKYKHCCGK
jgi:predicted aspartyl protease